MLVTMLWVVAAVAFVCGEICAVWAGAVYSGLMVKANQQLPAGQRFRWWESKSARHWAEAKRSFPHEARRSRRAGALSALCFAAAVGCASAAAHLPHHR